MIASGVFTRDNNTIKSKYAASSVEFVESQESQFMEKRLRDVSGSLLLSPTSRCLMYSVGLHQIWWQDRIFVVVVSILLPDIPSCFWAVVWSLFVANNKKGGASHLTLLPWLSNLGILIKRLAIPGYLAVDWALLL
eukprot:Gb_14556 [translate_table: standard]